MTTAFMRTTIRYVRATSEAPVGGELNAAVARAVVGIHHDYVGRGPMKARAFFRHDILVVLLEEVMTPIERSLAAGKRPEAVQALRSEFTQTMRDALVAAVELLSGSKVKALMSDSHVDPDMEAHVFVLDRPVPGQGEPGAASPNSS
jgi:uncharacterized protein YbcI